MPRGGRGHLGIVAGSVRATGYFLHARPKGGHPDRECVSVVGLAHSIRRNVTRGSLFLILAPRGASWPSLSKCWCRDPARGPIRGTIRFQRCFGGVLKPAHFQGTVARHSEKVPPHSPIPAERGGSLHITFSCALDQPHFEVHRGSSWRTRVAGIGARIGSIFVFQGAQGRSTRCPHCFGSGG
jgi:hypothetical protein